MRDRVVRCMSLPHPSYIGFGPYLITRSSLSLLWLSRFKHSLVPSCPRHAAFQDTGPTPVGSERRSPDMQYVPKGTQSVHMNRIRWYSREISMRLPCVLHGAERAEAKGRRTGKPSYINVSLWSWVVRHARLCTTSPFSLRQYVVFCKATWLSHGAEYRH